jgi:hypothetical protein
VRRIALKRLTASDLTFFEWQFKNQPAGNQKAINLNADVFIDQLYPALPAIALPLGGRIPIDLHVYGPGLTGDDNLQRKIIKAPAYKNWRLDGEFIYNPSNQPGRFNALAPNDFAVIEFVGEPLPVSANIIFVAKAAQADAGVFQELSGLIGANSMVVVDPKWFEAMATRLTIPDSHPINVVRLETVLEDAAQGGIEGIDQLSRHAVLVQVSREGLQRARESARAAGDLGEEHVDAYLRELKASNQIADFEWTSMLNAVAPFDFRLHQNDGMAVSVEVKATAGLFEAIVHISLNELRAMNTGTDRYDLYRVFEMTSDTAKLRIAQDMKAFAAKLLATTNGLPTGVTIDSVSVAPSVLNFGKEVIIQLPASP